MFFRQIVSRSLGTGCHIETGLWLSIVIREWISDHPGTFRIEALIRKLSRKSHITCYNIGRRGLHIKETMVFT